MRQKVLIALIIVGAFLYWFYLDRSHRESQDLVGHQAPPFSLPSSLGKDISLEEFKDKVVLVHFWATWCAPCLEEIPSLDRLNKKLAGQPFVLLAISEDEDGDRSVSEFRKKIHFDFPVLFDKTWSVSGLYGTFKLPESYLISKEGRVVRKIVGPQNWDNPFWEEEIQRYF